MSMLLTLALASGLWPLSALADLNSDVSNSQLQFNLDPIVVARINPVTRNGVDMLTCGAMVVGGANNVNPASTSDSLRLATCTTSPLGGTSVDNSVFGTSMLYHVLPNGTFSAVHVNEIAVTYTLYGNNVESFPTNFAMSLGDPRGYDPKCGQNGGKLPFSGYFYSDNGNINVLNQGTTGQMGWTMTYPDCWDGQPFGPEDQSEHMAFHQNTDGWPCPAGFSHKLMQVSVNVYFHTDGLASNPNGPTYVLGSGDQYGCSTQGFYIPAFQMGVQDDIISQCKAIGHGNTAKCAPLKITDSSLSTAQACQYTESIPKEDIGAAAPINPMPGCNVIGSRPHKCNPRVDFTTPSAFDTHLRGHAGLPIWPSHPAPGSSTPAAPPKSNGPPAGTPATTSQISTHNLYITNEVSWAGKNAALWYEYNTCYSLANAVNDFVFFHAFRSAGTDDNSACTLYRYSNCTDTSLALPKGGLATFGNLNANFGAFKCTAR
ncbi:hypothetical protein ESCO_005336 [Escovopsis weberi]|uniref:DUF1996 domain-containing protein n=1 Tax=Escovopsis weberi TaxID=150374 RepID=A0A0M9VUW5_ESCWE|nr:hypothetical protein ESCO_005336 [Escovopsis weberi]